MPPVRRAADRARVAIGLGAVCLSRTASAQADVGQLSGLVNFLDAGLTTLGAASALARSVLSVETAQREYVLKEDLFRRYQQATKPHCPKNGADADVMFGVLTSSENVSIAKEVVSLRPRSPVEQPENSPLDQWHAAVKFLVVHRYDWLPHAAPGQLLLPYNNSVADGIDEAVLDGCASRDEDQRGELQLLLRTLQGSSSRHTVARNVANLAASSHYMGSLELVLACVLAVLFRVDTLSSFLAARRVVSSFMTGRSGRSMHWGWFLSKVERVAWRDSPIASDPQVFVAGNAYSLTPLADVPAHIKRWRPYLVLLVTLGAFGGWTATVMKRSQWQVSGNYQLVHQLSTVIGYSVLLALGVGAACFDAGVQQTNVFEFGVTDSNYAAAAGIGKASLLTRFRICLESVLIDGRSATQAQQNRTRNWLMNTLAKVVRYTIYLAWVLLLGGAIALVICSKYAAEGVGQRGREARVSAAYALASLGAWWVWFVAASAREAELRLSVRVTRRGTVFYAFPFLYIAVMASVSGPWRGD